MLAKPDNVTSIRTAITPTKTLAFSFLESKLSEFPQIGSLNNKTPKMRAMRARHLAQEYLRRSKIVLKRGRGQDFALRKDGKHARTNVSQTNKRQNVHGTVNECQSDHFARFLYQIL